MCRTYCLLADPPCVTELLIIFEPFPLPVAAITCQPLIAICQAIFELVSSNLSEEWANARDPCNKLPDKSVSIYICTHLLRICASQ